MRFQIREKRRDKPGSTPEHWKGEPSDEWTPAMGLGALETEMRQTLLAGLNNLPSVEGTARWAVDAETGAFLMGWAFVRSGRAGPLKWQFVRSAAALHHDVKHGYLEEDPFISPP